MNLERLTEIRALIEQKAAMHPELRRPLGLAGFRRVVKRESVELIMRPHPRIAQLVPSVNGWALVIDRDQPGNARLMCGCHELAHLWLHHDPTFPRWETSIYDVSPMWFDDEREREANVCAELMIAGPEAAKTTTVSARALLKKRAPVIPDPDGDAFVDAMWKHVQTERAPPPRPVETVHFSLQRDLWERLDFEEVRRHGQRTPIYDFHSVSEGFVRVTCSPDAASALVETLARNGYKRPAAMLRRHLRLTYNAEHAR
jgi:hypothetical protein